LGYFVPILVVVLSGGGASDNRRRGGVVLRPTTRGKMAEETCEVENVRDLIPL